MRLPKSPYLGASMPESTNAMPGAFGAGERTEPVSVLMPVATRQMSPDVRLCPLTRPFGVIDRTVGSADSESSCEPVRFATMPRMTEKGTRSRPPAFRTCSFNADDVAVGWPRTMTLSVASGFAVAWFFRGGGTKPAFATAGTPNMHANAMTNTAVAFVDARV